MNDETASRLATTAGSLPGVQSAVVCSDEGILRGSTPQDSPERMAVLVGFLVARGRAAIDTDDIRGLGRTVREGRIEQIVFGGQRSEGVLLANESTSLLAMLDRGASAAAVAPLLATALRRYTAAAA